MTKQQLADTMDQPVAPNRIHRLADQLAEELGDDDDAHTKSGAKRTKAFST